MQDLGTLRRDKSGNSEALGVSADGAVVVGYSVHDLSSAQRAFRWTSGGGMQDLGTLRQGNKGASEALGVSADGAVVVGEAQNDDGDWRAFIWAIPKTTPSGGVAPSGGVTQSGGIMLDHLNTLDQVYENSVQQLAAAGVVQSLSAFALGQELTVRRDEACLSAKEWKTNGCRAPVAMRVTVGGAANRDSIDLGVAGVTAAVGITPTLTLGGYFGLGTEVDSLQGFGIDGAFRSVGAYLRHDAGAGVTWKLAYGQSGSNVDISRGMQRPNTEFGTGNSKMTSRGALAEIGYKFSQNQFNITPFGRLIHSNYKRDAYSERSNIAFPVTYDEYKQSETVAALGVKVEFPVSAKGLMELTGGLEADISRSGNPISGTSRIPGMASFEINAPEVKNKTRGFLSGRYQHYVTENGAIEVSAGVTQSVYVSAPTVLAAIGYRINF